MNMEEDAVQPVCREMREKERTSLDSSGCLLLKRLRPRQSLIPLDAVAWM